MYVLQDFMEDRHCQLLMSLILSIACLVTYNSRHVISRFRISIICYNNHFFRSVYTSAMTFLAFVLVVVMATASVSGQGEFLLPQKPEIQLYRFITPL